MREPRCKVCKAVIVEVLSDTGPANDFLCLGCSGATLEDFMDEGEYSENRIDEMRTFHGKSQYD